MNSLRFTLFLLISSFWANGQSDTFLAASRLRFLDEPKGFHKTRFWVTSGITASAYVGAVVTLNQLWYAQYPRQAFHFKDDFGGWGDVDKFGHLATAYWEARWGGQILRHWAGVSPKASAWLGFGAAMLFQTTFETLDGFSAGWGWSWGDIGFNTLGASTYLVQELAWHEQRITIKYSTTYHSYPDAPITSTNGQAVSSLQQRGYDLYGKNIFQTLLKDYNSATFWASANVRSFFPKATSIPSYLNVALGYSSENMFGAEQNEWTDNAGNKFVAPISFPRHTQILLAPDLDFTRIKTKSRFLKVLFSTLNVIKIPSPALEYNSLGQFKFHWLYF